SCSGTSERLQQANPSPGPVGLGWKQAVACTLSKLVVIGVPGFAQGQDTEEPMVARQVRRAVRPMPKHVRHAVDGIAQVVDECQGQPEDGDAPPAPEQKGNPEEESGVEQDQDEVRARSTDEAVVGIRRDLRSQVLVLSVAPWTVIGIEERTNRTSDGVEKARHRIVTLNVPADVSEPKPIHLGTMRVPT